MPELPEVETMRRAVAPVAGSRVVAVERPPCRKRALTIEPALPALRRRVVGRTVLEVGRLGKRVLLLLEGGDRLVFEPRMTGLVLLRDPPTQEHLRLRLRLEGGPAPELLYWDRRGLGVISLLDPARFQARCAGRLGPDALGIDAPTLIERLGSSLRPIKVALLDQAALAGVGNIYASESLHRAGIRPARPCRRLRAPEWERLAAALREVLETAVQNEGSDLGDGTYRSALGDRASYQSLHRVYGRAGEPCPTCRRGLVRRTIMAQRATFHCPRCQR